MVRNSKNQNDPGKMTRISSGVQTVGPKQQLLEGVVRLSELVWECRLKVASHKCPNGGSTTGGISSHSQSVCTECTSPRLLGHPETRLALLDELFILYPSDFGFGWQ